jgi:hypothetical protein
MVRVQVRDGVDVAANLLRLRGWGEDVLHQSRDEKERKKKKKKKNLS